MKQVTGVAIFVSIKSVSHLNNQRIKKGNSHRLFVMINWATTENVLAIPLYTCLSGTSFNNSQFLIKV